MPPIGVYIKNYPDDPMRQMKCLNCGHFIMEYKGRLAYVMIGDDISADIVKSDNKSLIKVLCRKCKTMYNILIFTFENPIVKPEDINVITRKVTIIGGQFKA